MWLVHEDGTGFESVEFVDPELVYVSVDRVQMASEEYLELDEIVV